MRIPWRVVVSFWTIVAFFFIAANVGGAMAAGRPVDWEWDVSREALYWALWVALTPAIIFWFDRFPLQRTPRAIALHSVGAVAVAAVQVAGTRVIHMSALLLLGRLTAARAGDWLRGRPGNTFFLLFTAFWKYWVVIALLLGWRYARLYFDAQRMLAQSQLERLKSQLQPHFLFNTLNSISVLVRDDPVAAQQMIVQLSDLLRLAIETRDTQLVTLREELEFTQRYLAIQKLRFAERLQVHVSVTPEAMEKEVPLMLLQPLVENSIQHGLMGAEAGIVEIIAYVEPGRLVISIWDEATGFGRVRAESPGNGIGLANARSRLEWIYGGGADLLLAPNGSNGSVVTIRVPVAQ